MRIQLDGRTAPFALLTVFVAATFLLGGSAADDVLSLIILRPLSVIFLSLGLFLLPHEVLRERRLLLLLACALPLLTLIHLLPLPPALWRSLPGRELAWEIGAVAGIEQPWRPISLVPYRTWNSFWSLFTPMAALVLALAVPRDHSRKLVYLLAAIILISGILGLLQSIGGQGNGFYFYRVTNEDSAVGLFANRNHQAMLLAIAFPTLAAAASLSKGSREAARPKLWLALGAGGMTLPFLLATESRAGLLLGVLGMAMAFFVYQDPAAHLQAGRQAIKAYYKWLGIVVAAAGLIVTMIMVGRMSSVQRLFMAQEEPDLRFRVWGPIAEAVWQYFPVGSGFGTFVEVYKVIEPERNLAPKYLNHAHNDWLEVVLTGGLPAVILILVIAAALGAAMVRAFRPSAHKGGPGVAVPRLGAATILILAVGSLYDYPLRVPSLACLFAVAVVWLLQSPRAGTSLHS